jgi:outer membrane protein, heavy metal efflux system
MQRLGFPMCAALIAATWGLNARADQPPALSGAPDVATAEPDPGGRLPAVWTIDSATLAGAERAPRVRSARAALDTARAYRAYGSMSKVGNPVVNLRAMIGKPDSPAATYSLLLGLPFDVSGKRNTYRSEASWVERQAEAELAAALNEARSEARKAFVEVATGEAEVKVLQLNQEIAADFASRVQARFDAKAGTALDLALSQRDYAESVANLARAQRRLAEARLAFRLALDLPPDAGLAVEPLPTLELPPGITPDNVVQLARTRRREALALSAGAQRKRVQQTRARREAVGPLVLAAEGERQGVQNPQSSLGASLQTELPFILKNQGDVAIARGESSQFAVQSELTDRQIGREAFAAFASFEAALAEFTAIDQQATPAAERALDMTVDMLEAGAVDVFRVLSARQVAFALRLRRVEVLREAWLLRVQLERAVAYEEDLR